MALASRSLRPERAFLHPLWVGSLVLLVVNDHFFKGAGILHDIATGKLSDVAGMLVAPALLAAIAGVRTRRGLLAAHAAVAVVFAALEVSPLAARFAEHAMTAAGVPWKLWPDLTDLLALPCLALSWRFLAPAMAEPVVFMTRLARLGELTFGTVAFLACVGTSQVQPQPAAPVQPVAGDAERVAPPGKPDGDDLVGRWRSLDPRDAPHTYHFKPDGTFVRDGEFHEVGRFVVDGAGADALFVELVQRESDGFRSEDQQRTLHFDGQRGTFVMDGRRYSRIDAVVADGAAAN
jgi:hypothetical protein